MTPEEAKDKMEDMAGSVGNFWLPDGFKVSINVPMEVANLTRLYYDQQTPFSVRGPYAAGEVFYYKGIRCFAS